MGKIHTGEQLLYLDSNMNIVAVQSLVNHEIGEIQVNLNT